MAFTPDSTIYLINTPFDASYKNVLRFTSLTAQQNYFIGRKVQNATNYSYIRKDRILKVPFHIDTLWNVNYCMYKNTHFSSKYFYCFVNKMEYVNDNCTALYIETDVYQTWLFDITIKDSFVEREMAVNDTIGANTVPENLEIGCYVTTNSASKLPSGYSLYILATEEPTDGIPSPTVPHPPVLTGMMQPPKAMGGLPQPLYWNGWSNIDDASLETMQIIIDAYAACGKLDAIVGLFALPTDWTTTGTNALSASFSLASRSLGYTPRNNKLYTYPYCSLVFVSGGQSHELRYENFSGSPTAELRGGFGMNTPIFAYPKNYEGQTNAYQYGITIKDFPILPWVGSYYQNWIAQNRASLLIGVSRAAVPIAAGAIGALAAPATGGTSLAVGAAVAGVASAGLGVADALVQTHKADIIPDQMHGSAAAGDISIAARIAGFYSYCRAIKPEYLKIIDDYFDMFGYKTNQVKMPNLTSRSNWNYVKTIDIDCTGNLPQDDLIKFKNIFDNGVTIWHNPATMYDYSQTNN